MAGINMAGGDELYEGTIPSNVLKVVGINLVSAGEIDVEGKFDSMVKKDINKYLYRKIVVRDDIIIGCILLGDFQGMKEILDAIEKRKPISAVKILAENLD